MSIKQKHYSKNDFPTEPVWVHLLEAALSPGNSPGLPLGSCMSYTHLVNKKGTRWQSWERGKYFTHASGLDHTIFNLCFRSTHHISFPMPVKTNARHCLYRPWNRWFINLLPSRLDGESLRLLCLYIRLATLRAQREKLSYSALLAARQSWETWWANSRGKTTIQHWELTCIQV